MDSSSRSEARTSGAPSSSESARREFPWATALIAGLAVAVYFVPATEAKLEFDRERIAAGEFWRLATAHFVHYGGTHLFWDALIVIAAGGWAERIAAWRTRIFYVLAPWVISGALLALDPTLQRYAGLSGIGAGVLALLAVVQLGRPEQRDKRFWRGVLLLLAAKIALELFSREPGFARFAAGIQSVPLAHLAGVGCAMLVYFARRRRR